MYIYKITNIINGKIYIGQTIETIKKRWNDHSNNKSKNTILANAIRKYGRENFKVEEIGGANNITELNYQEWINIHKYNSLHPNGYNMIEGGNSFIPTNLVRQKMRKAQLGKKQSKETIAKRVAKISGDKHHRWNLGKKHTKEHREKISKALKGKKVSEETKEKLRQAKLGRKLSEETKKKISDYVKKNPQRYWQGKKRGKPSKETRQKISKALKGKKVSEETKEKLRQANLGRKLSEETKEKLRQANLGRKSTTNKPVLCIETGKVYRTLREAAKEVGLKTPSNITMVIKGKRKTAAGYTWKYATAQ